MTHEKRITQLARSLEAVLGRPGVVKWVDARQAPVAEIGGLRFTDEPSAGAGVRGVFEIVDDLHGGFHNVELVRQ